MFITFLLIMLAVTLTFFIVSKLAVEKIEQNHYKQRADLYRYSKIQKGDVVFLGDSITDGGCWDELFQDMNIKNRGINGDDTVGVLARLDDILCCTPSALFILIGTNDMNWWNYRHDKEILANYREILQRCKDQSPDTKVFVESILPRTKRHSNHLRMLNIHLEKLAEEFDCTFINLFPHFADENGALKAEFNNDHLHLMAPGYALWVKLLTPYLDNFRKK
ncbi:MAG: sialate O-acetylesterase [Chloroflexi bacterium HGW-Chloroflexi-5]|nr:MAG: sialate O-acetylesterase [Chloroflexi bacterium HGW-Chloroflexi-5]